MEPFYTAVVSEAPSLPNCDKEPAETIERAQLQKANEEIERLKRFGKRLADWIDGCIDVSPIHKDVIEALSELRGCQSPIVLGYTIGGKGEVVCQERRRRG